MAKTKLLGADKERQLKEQQRAAKKANRKPMRGPVRWFKDIIGELKKVTWPTWKQLLTTAGAVFVFIAIMAVITGLFDMGLSKWLQWMVS